MADKIKMTYHSANSAQDNRPVPKWWHPEEHEHYADERHPYADPEQYGFEPRQVWGTTFTRDSRCSGTVYSQNRGLRILGRLAVAGIVAFLFYEGIKLKNNPDILYHLFLPENVEDLSLPVKKHTIDALVNEKE